MYNQYCIEIRGKNVMLNWTFWDQKPNPNKKRHIYPPHNKRRK